MQDLVRIAQAGKLPHIPVAERSLSAAEVSRALDDLTAGGGGGRIVLTA
jgi:alcohol dehydrogenase/propanol-preferring alcohol dehydrogenase